MDPSHDDMADTISASYRTMKEMSAQIQAMFDLVLYLQISVALLAGALTFLIIRKAMTNG